MPCLNCGVELRNDSKFCDQCGAPSTVTPTKLLDTSVPEIEQSQKTPRAIGRGVNLRIALVLIWTAFLTFTRNIFSAETVGMWIGMMVFPLLLAYVVSRAWKRDSQVRFSYWFLAFGILLPCLTIRNSLSRLSHPDLTRELVGTKPLEDNLPENEKEMASVSRDFFADVTSFRKSYDEQMSGLEHDLRQLYTADSFSSRDAIQRSLNVVEKKLALDREASMMFGAWPESVKARLDKTNLSDADKKKFLTGFMEKFSSSSFLSARQQMMVVESNWADSARDLYTFALERASQIVVAKNGIDIANGATREQFNVKLARSEKLRDDYVAAAKKVDEIRSANMKSDGITPADIGLDK